MKKLLFIATLFVTATVTAQNKKTYELDTKQSTINWRGYYTFLFSEHTGTVSFTKGALETINGNISGGFFVIDMKSITNKDYEEGIGPVKHLKDSDFFDVEKFPTATLKITKIEYFADNNIHKIIANLTIKGITKSQEFWATANGSKKQLTTKFKIDRTRWGITYNNRLKNEAIADAIEFEVKLQFK
jgi:polyisoprenoid-binding protein YceI